MKIKYVYIVFLVLLVVVSACRQQEVPQPTTADTKENKQVVLPIEDKTSDSLKDDAMTKDTTTQDTTPKTPLEATPPPTEPKITSYVVKADDSSLDPKIITVKKGEILKITFQVSKNNVYYGGLDFRSDYFKTKTVLPRDSIEITLTPDKSFSYTSYWPSSGVQKTTGQINVI